MSEQDFADEIEGRFLLPNSEAFDFTNEEDEENYTFSHKDEDESEDY